MKWFKYLFRSHQAKPIDLKDRDEVIAATLIYLEDVRFEDASRLVASYEALQPEPRGMGIDWSNHSPVMDMHILKEVFASLPKDHLHLDASSLNMLRVVAGMMYLWGVNNLEDLASKNLLRNIDEKDVVIAQELLFNALKKKYKYRDRFFDRFCRGFIFSATPQLRTPLSVLIHHGETIGLEDEHPDYGDLWMGHWHTLLKTHAELGINFPETLPSTQSSDIGYIQLYGINGIESDYHKFLYEFRVLAESKEKLLFKRIEKINALAIKSPQYADLWKRLSKVYMEFPNSFFYNHLMQSPEIGVLEAKKLVDAGFCTIFEIIQSSDEEFLKVQGIPSDILLRIKLLAKEPENFVGDLYKTFPLWYLDQCEREKSLERNTQISQIANNIGIDPKCLPRKMLLSTWIKVERVISILAECNYDHNNLPKQLDGKLWVKSEVKKIALKDSQMFTESSFDSLWSDMRKLRIIKVHGEVNDSQERLSFNSGWKELKKLEASKRRR